MESAHCSPLSDDTDNSSLFKHVFNKLSKKLFLSSISATPSLADETISTSDSIVETETSGKQSYWGWRAMLLALIALLTILYWSYSNKFVFTKFGNQQNFVIDSVTTTHRQVP